MKKFSVNFQNLLESTSLVDLHSAAGKEREVGDSSLQIYVSVEMSAMKKTKVMRKHPADWGNNR